MVGFQVHHALHTTWHYLATMLHARLAQYRLKCTEMLGVGPSLKKKPHTRPRQVCAVHGAVYTVLATMIRPCKPRDSARPALLTLNLQQAVRNRRSNGDRVSHH